MVYLPILFPLLMAALAFAVPSGRWRPWLLPLGGLGHLGLVLVAIFHPGDGTAVCGLGGWLLMDPLGKVVLGFLSLASPAPAIKRRLRQARLRCESG